MGADRGGDAGLVRAPEQRRGHAGRERLEDRAGPRREGVLALFAQVDEPAPPIHETGTHAEGGGQHDGRGGAAQRHRARRGRPPARGKETAGDRECEHQHDPEICERTRPHPPARQLLDPAPGTDRGHRIHDPRRQPVVEPAGGAVAAEDGQPEQDARAGHERGGGVCGHRRGGERDGVEGRQQCESGEPCAGHRTVVRLAEPGDRGGEGRGQQKYEREHHQPGKKLPGDQRAVPDRQGHRELQAAVVGPRRPRAHRQRRDEHDRGPRKEQHEEPHRRLVGGEELADHEDRDAQAQREPEREHVAHGGVEGEPHLVAHDREGAPDGAGHVHGLIAGHVRPRSRQADGMWMRVAAAGTVAGVAVAHRFCPGACADLMAGHARFRRRLPPADGTRARAGPVRRRDRRGRRRRRCGPGR